MPNFFSDHFALRAGLLRRPTRCHIRYFRERRAFPLRILPSEELSSYDAKFQTLDTLEPPPPNLKDFPLPLWMSPYSIRLFDERASLHQNQRYI